MTTPTAPFQWNGADGSNLAISVQPAELNPMLARDTEKRLLTKEFGTGVSLVASNKVHLPAGDASFVAWRITSTVTTGNRHVKVATDYANFYLTNAGKQYVIAFVTTSSGPYFQVARGQLQPSSELLDEIQTFRLL